MQYQFTINMQKIYNPVSFIQIEHEYSQRSTMAGNYQMANHNPHGNKRNDLSK